jgi:hypothetical protein
MDRPDELRSCCVRAAKTPPFWTIHPTAVFVFGAGEMQIKDIQAVVVACQNPNCAYLARVPLDQFGHFMRNNQSCPLCRGWLWPTTVNQSPPFYDLQNAIMRIAAMGTVGIIFSDTTDALCTIIPAPAQQFAENPN